MRLKNTYTGKIEPFEPLDPQGKQVTIYTCGPTVYSFAHIGNFRSFLFADVLRRALERAGYAVRQVMNITDVGHLTEDHIADASGEDKLSRAAREIGSDPYSVAAHFEDVFIEDARTLRLRNYQAEDAENRDLHPQATRHVAEMLAMIQALIERGYAYCDSQGQAYFEIAKFAEYGTLSGKRVDDLEDGARVAVRSEKKDPRDFALWKVDDKHLMKWDPHSPAGWPEGDFEKLRALVPGGLDKRLKAGFPGWHIECSAMSRAHLGDRIDIHTGGEDNIFPHHECEVAQSYGATLATVPAPTGTDDAGSERKTFSRYWVHGRHLLVNNRKMSKRDGTFYTVRDLLDPTAEGRADLAASLDELGFAGGRVPATVLRYALIANQYTQPMNFNFDALVQAKSSVERLQSLYERLRELADAGAAGEASADAPGEASADAPGEASADAPGEASAGASGEASAAVREIVDARNRGFDDGLHDNLNMPNALAEVFHFVREVNQLDLTAADAAAALAALDGFDAVLDVLDRRRRSGLLDTGRIDEIAASAGSFEDLMALDTLTGDAVEALLALRAAARKQKDWGRADAIRDHLKAKHVVTEDTPRGVRWKLTD